MNLWIQRFFRLFALLSHTRINSSRLISQARNLWKQRISYVLLLSAKSCAIAIMIVRPWCCGQYITNRFKYTCEWINEYSREIGLRCERAHIIHFPNLFLLLLRFILYFHLNIGRFYKKNWCWEKFEFHKNKYWEQFCECYVTWI